MADSGYNISNVPSVESLEQLPRWAVVAFAGRCASRVEPLLRQAWSDEHDKQIDVLVGSNALVRAVAADPKNKRINIQSSINQARIAYSTLSDTKLNSKSKRANDIEFGGHNAASSAVLAALTLETSRAIYEYAGNSADDSAYAIRSMNHSDISCIHRDYELLLAASKRERWNDETSVPQDFFGPLWPNGEPKWWPSDETHNDQPIVLKLELVVPDNMGDKQAQEYDTRVAAFLSEMSALHAAMGGNGLRILDHDSCSPEFAVQEDPERYPVVVGGAS